MEQAPAISIPQARSYPITRAVVWLMVIFIVFFPKAGIKIGDIPFTFGYAVLSFSFPVLLFLRFTVFPLRFGKLNVLAAASLLPFQVLFLYCGLANGIDSVGGLLSEVTIFFLCPIAFLLVYPAFLPRIDPVWLSRWFRISILGAALFGIYLFFSYPLFGQFVQIPYLTVNADDYGLIESTKHISRGAFLKLISTYNNGNIYGVCMLMLLPIYNQVEHRRWPRVVLRIALVLTLSRTVWLGLIVEQLLSLLRVGIGAAQTFPRFTAGPAVKRSLFIVVTILMVLVGLMLSSGNFAFLFDSELGGRVGTIQSAAHPTWLPKGPISFFLEIVYVSALNTYGILGFLAIILIFAFPIALFFADRRVLDSPIRLAAFKGLLLYAVLAGVDGAINYIPVMAFYWFIYMVFLEGWPGANPSRVPPALAYAQASPLSGPDKLTTSLLHT